MGSLSKMKEFRRQNALSIIEENPSNENYETNDIEPEIIITPRRKNSVNRNAVVLKSRDLEQALVGNQKLQQSSETKRNARVVRLSEYVDENEDKLSTDGLNVSNDNVSVCFDDSSSGHGSESEDNDLGTLKQQATKLKLKTRRSSYVTWRTQCLVKSGALMKPRLRFQNETVENNSDDDGVLTDERKDKINNSLTWIRNELSLDEEMEEHICGYFLATLNGNERNSYRDQITHEMRIQDQELARKLLALRQDIQSLRLKWSCEDHQELLEDMTCDLEERQILHSICDLPLDPIDFQHMNPLKQLGVTPMNINARRFSTC